MQPLPGRFIAAVRSPPFEMCCSLEQSTKHLVSASARQGIAAGLSRDDPSRVEFVRLGAWCSLNPLHLKGGTLTRGRACTRARGDERLSVKDKGGSFRNAKAVQKKSPDEKKSRKQKASDIGRALRTIYDDTLREAVPDDFSDLLGKLS